LTAISCDRFIVRKFCTDINITKGIITGILKTWFSASITNFTLSFTQYCMSRTQCLYWKRSDENKHFIIIFDTNYCIGTDLIKKIWFSSNLIFKVMRNLHSHNQLWAKRGPGHSRDFWKFKCRSEEKCEL
jgi:hypothetical protein